MAKKSNVFGLAPETSSLLQHKPADYPSFEIRNLIANGEVWTGNGEQTRKLFPEISTLKPADFPAENPCSCAIRLRYGKFGYYTGGDLTNDTNYGRDPWRDSESPAAEVCGPVSVAVANHHGYFNANGDRYVRALQPQVFIIPTWDSAHPTVNVLNTLFSKAIYPREPRRFRNFGQAGKPYRQQEDRRPQVARRTHRDPRGTRRGYLRRPHPLKRR